MPRMRTLPKALEELRKEDPGTSVTITQMRRWAKSGKIVTVKAGKNFLCDLDSLETFLSGGAEPAENADAGESVAV